MIDINSIDTYFSEQSNEILDWCNFEYDGMFAPYFTEMEELYQRLKSDNNPITDDELEIILTDIPLQLYSVSEILATYKTKVELVKLNLKNKKYELANSPEFAEYTKTERNAKISYELADDETLIKLYLILIERVERQIGFSKELIMSAKKIWSARRSTESIGAVSDSVDLPDYSSMVDKDYIKGV